MDTVREVFVGFVLGALFGILGVFALVARRLDQFLNLLWELLEDEVLAPMRKQNLRQADLLERVLRQAFDRVRGAFKP